MRSFVILAVLGVCAAFPQGFIQDTPEVQAEKARFNQLFAQQAAAAAAAPDIHIFSRTAGGRAVTGGYQGPLAATVPAGLPGAGANIAPTADVQQATAEFFRAYQAAVAAANPKATQAGAQPRWTGPVAATVPAGLPGSSPVVADTADVQAAKAAFGQAFSQQLRAVAPKL